MLKPRYLVAITGRRQLSKPDAVRSALAAALGELRDLVGQRGGRLELYSSIACGADTLAVLEARKLQIPVHLVLPKPVVHDKETGAVNPRDGFAADFWDGNPGQGGKFRQQEWDDAFAEIECARKGENGGSLRQTLGSQSDPECYYDAGLQVLDAADVLLAVLDDEPDHGLGGSKSVVALAEKQRLPLMIVQASTGDTERHRLDRLAPNDDGRRLIVQLESLSGSSGPDEIREEDRMAALFERLDERTARDAEKFRNSLVRAIICQGVATLLASAGALLPQVSRSWMGVIAALAVIEFCLIAYALWQTVWLTRKNGVHDRWLLTRFALEVARPMKDCVGLLDPLHPLIAKYQPRWRRFALTVGLLIHHTQARRPWREARDIYVRDRLRHADPRVGQITYFARAFARAEPRFRRAVWWGKLFGTAALLFVMCALTMKCYTFFDRFHNFHPPAAVSIDKDWVAWARDITFRFVPIALPALAGLFLALRTALDSGRRTYRYGEIAERLAAAAETLESLETESSVRRNVAYTEEVLLDELVEWHTMEEQNGAR